MGFEPTRGDPIGLAGRRLSRSAKVSLQAAAAAGAIESAAFLNGTLGRCRRQGAFLNEAWKHYSRMTVRPRGRRPIHEKCTELQLSPIIFAAIFSGGFGSGLLHLTFCKLPI